MTHDATQDDKFGMAFSARLRLDGSKLNIDGGLMGLSAGMALNEEIKTGKRRVVDCLVKSLRHHVGEGMAER